MMLHNDKECVAQYKKDVSKNSLITKHIRPYDDDNNELERRSSVRKKNKLMR